MATKAWCSLCAKNNIRNQEVVHQDKEFTRPFPLQHGQKSMSTLAGAQCVDRTWKALKHYLPNKKMLKHPHAHALSPYFEHEVLAWAWCKNLGQMTAKSFLSHLTKVR